MRCPSRFRAGLFLAVILATGVASACTIPVFRFALDRWEADPFRLVVPEKWATDREMVKLLVPLRGNAAANVIVEESGEPGLDRAKLLFPHDEVVQWEGALDESTLSLLLDSPVRRELVRRILAGESVIWVVATREGDQEEVERIASRLTFLEQVAELPVQNPDDPDSQLGPGPALKLEFSVLPLSLDDPAERLFARMLAGPAHAELVEEGTAFAAPVFGRGRVLGSWPLAELDDLMIEDTSLFLTGRCSCRVKNENPGWDLLLKVDWENALEAARADRVEEPAGEAPAAFPVAAEGTGTIETVVIAPPAEATPGKRSAPSLIALVGIVLALIFALAGWRLWRVR